MITKIINKLPDPRDKAKPAFNSDKMSVALVQALDDLDSLSNLPGYCVNMHAWVTYDSERSSADKETLVTVGCSFCLAGAVLLRRFDEYDHDYLVKGIDPCDVGGPVERMLYALDALRQYKFASAFRHRYFNELDHGKENVMSMAETSAMFMVTEHLQYGYPTRKEQVSYQDNPEKFYDNMLQIAGDLEDHGF